MKKIFIIFNLLIILVGCDEQKNNLNGEWTVTNIDLKVKNKKKYTKQLKARFRTQLNKETDLDYYKYNEILKLNEGSIYNFKLNNSITITYSNTELNNNKSLETNYILSENKKKLSIGNLNFLLKVNSLKNITLKKVSLTNNKDTLFTTLIKNYD